MHVGLKSRLGWLKREQGRPNPTRFVAWLSGQSSSSSSSSSSEAFVGFPSGLPTKRMARSFAHSVVNLISQLAGGPKALRTLPPETLYSGQEPSRGDGWC